MDRSRKRQSSQPSEEGCSPSKVPQSSPTGKPCTSIRKSGRDRKRSVRVPDDFNLPSYASINKRSENSKESTHKMPEKESQKNSNAYKKPGHDKETIKMKAAKGKNDVQAVGGSEKKNELRHIKKCTKESGKTDRSKYDHCSSNPSDKSVANKNQKIDSSLFYSSNSKSILQANNTKQENNFKKTSQESQSMTAQVSETGENSSTSSPITPQRPSHQPVQSKSLKSSLCSSETHESYRSTPTEDISSTNTVQSDNKPSVASHSPTVVTKSSLSQASDVKTALIDISDMKKENTSEYDSCSAVVAQNDTALGQDVASPSMPVVLETLPQPLSERVVCDESKQVSTKSLPRESKDTSSSEPEFRPSSSLLSSETSHVAESPHQKRAWNPKFVVVKKLGMPMSVVTGGPPDNSSGEKSLLTKVGTSGAPKNHPVVKHNEDKQVVNVDDISSPSHPQEDRKIIHSVTQAPNVCSSNMPMMSVQSGTAPSGTPAASLTKETNQACTGHCAATATTAAKPLSFLSLDPHVLSSLQAIPPFEAPPLPDELEDHDSYKAILQSIEIGQKSIQPVQDELFHVVAATISPTFLQGLKSAAMRYKVLKLIGAASGTKIIFLPGQTLMVGTGEQMMHARLTLNAMMTHAKDSKIREINAMSNETHPAADSPAPESWRKTMTRPSPSQQVTGTHAQASAYKEMPIQPKPENIPVTNDQTRQEDSSRKDTANKAANDAEMVQVIQMTEEGEVNVTWWRAKEQNDRSSWEEVPKDELVHGVKKEEASTKLKMESSLSKEPEKDTGQQESDGEYFPEYIPAEDLATAKVRKIACPQPKKYSPGSLQMKMKPGRSLSTLNPVRATNTCNLCGFKSSVDGIRKHMRRFHAKTTFVCPDCQKRFALPNDLKRHYKLHEKNTVLTNEVMKQHVFCEECGFQGSDVAVMQHISEMHIAEVVCSLCRRICESPEDLDRHIKKYHSQEAKEIKAIQDASRSLLSLGGIGRRGRKGKNTSHGYKCIWCGTMFSQEATLRYHLKVRHIDVQHYKCKICGKTYMDERVLKVHVRRLHLKEKRFFCEVCNKGFFEKRQLVKHRNTHLNGNNAQSYMCAFCGLHFTQQAHLKSHEKMHSERPSDDSETAGFGGGANLEINGGDDQKAFSSGMMSCGICHRSYRYRRSLYYHIRKIHGQEPRNGDVIYTPSYLLPDLQLQQPDGETSNLEEISRETQRSVEMVFRDLGVESQGGDAMIVEATQEEVEDEDSVVVYMCEVCQVLFTDMQELNKHFASAHPDVPMNLAKGDEENQEEDIKTCTATTDGDISVETCENDVVNYEVVASN